MLRHRLVRQSAINVNSSGESPGMSSPQLTRQRRSSQDSKLYRQISSESLDNLLGPAVPYQSSKAGARRHSVACGVLYVDIQKPSLKSAFNSAIKRMSSACSVLSSASSTSFNLAPQQGAGAGTKKEEDVLLPQVLGTFQKSRMPQSQGGSSAPDKYTQTFLVNRRFSTDSPPPSYSEVTKLWNSTSRQKLKKLPSSVPSEESLVPVEDDDSR